jgi:hypothetical protein
MGNCRFCHQPAGLLRSEHQTCLAKAHAVSLWGKLVEQYLEEGRFTEEREKQLDGLLLEEFPSPGDVATYDEHHAVSKLAKAHALRLVMSGKIPQFNVMGVPPVNLHKDEQVVWVFEDAKHIQHKTHRHYVGASHGLSIRVMRGVYYRTGIFEGQSVETHETIVADVGQIIATTKNLYFAGSHSSMRIPYGKVVSFLPFSDGFGFVRDGVSAQPQIFRMDDGWFCYNLITNLARIAE